jgi:carbohydrate kinase (thermoresistant glucokinase family)
MSIKLPNRVFVVMGVSGCGKTTLGKALAAALACEFYDGDDFHPPENVKKMASGVPLTDKDRAEWLRSLAEHITDCLTRGETAVFACSALKQSYRTILQGSRGEHVRFIYLEGNYDVIWQRLQRRVGHYMKADMLRSQFDTLEPPEKADALILDVRQTITEWVNAVMNDAAL